MLQRWRVWRRMVPRSSISSQCSTGVLAGAPDLAVVWAAVPAPWLGSTASQQPSVATLVASMQAPQAMHWRAAAWSGAHAINASLSELSSGSSNGCGSQQPQLHQQQRSIHASACAAAAGPGASQWRGLQGSAHSQRPGAASLGVIDKLHEETGVVLPSTGRRNFWEVLEFRPDATVLETWKTPEVLSLHPRDVYVFASEASYGSHRAMIAARPNAILFKTEICKAVVYHDKAVLFPTKRLQDTVRIAQALKSAICQKSALPFEFKVLEALLAETVRAYENKSKRLGIVAESVLSEINTNFHSSAGELQRLLPIQRKLTELQNDVKDVLDAIADIVNYDESVRALCLQENERKKAQVVKEQHTLQHQQAQAQQQWEAAQADWTQTQRQLKAAASLSAAAATGARDPTDQGQPSLEASQGQGLNPGRESNPGPAPSAAAAAAAAAMAAGGAAPPPQPPPLAKPAAAAAAALGTVNGGLNATPTSPKKRTSGMRMVTSVLEAYENKLLGIFNALREQLEGMEQTRTVWHMQLDHQRNRVLRINLLISIMSFGAVVCTMPAAFFGMNLASGLEDVPSVFWPVVQGSLVAGMSTGGLVYAYYKFGPKRRYKARLRDMRSLRDLLMFHLDDLDSIIDALKGRGRVSRAEFTAVVREAVKGRPMSQDEIDLVYRVFDTNKDGFLEITELMRLEDHLDAFTGTHLS